MWIEFEPCTTEEQKHTILDMIESEKQDRIKRAKKHPLWNEAKMVMGLMMPDILQRYKENLTS